MFELRVKGRFITAHADEAILHNEAAKYSAGWNAKADPPRPFSPKERGWKKGDPDLPAIHSFDPADVTVETKRPYDIMLNGCRVDTANSAEESSETIDALVKVHTDLRKPHPVIRALRRDPKWTQERVAEYVQKWYTVAAPVTAQ